MKTALLFLISFCCWNTTYSQRKALNLTKGTPHGAEFLLYNTDVHSSGMGNLKSIGLTNSFAIYSNPAKLSYQEDFLKNDIALSYSQVMPNIEKGMNIFSAASNNMFRDGNGREHYLAAGMGV